MTTHAGLRGNASSAWIPQKVFDSQAVTDGGLRLSKTATKFLKEFRVKHVTWHIVFNNTTSTRPSALGGHVARPFADHKHFESDGASFATPITRCTLRLPNSFAADDGKVLEVIGVGTTRDEASEDACCGAMVKLLCAEPSNVLLQLAH